jgi:hypothetical protein
MRELLQDSEMIGRRGALRGLLVPILAAPLSLATRTALAAMPPSLWRSAQVLIGHSLVDQAPSPVIECPLFFDNGQPANGVHTLDLSALPAGPPRATVSHGDDMLEVELGDSLVVAFAEGGDIVLVADDVNVSGGTGFFSNVTRMIIRCVQKVKVEPAVEPPMGEPPPPPLLIACVHCVIMLIRS